MNFVADAAPLPGGGADALLEPGVIGRVTPAGRLDRRFGRAGFASVGFGDGNVSANTLLPHPDGGYLALGGADIGTPAVSRITSRGRLIPTFGQAGVAKRIGGPSMAAIRTRAIIGRTVYLLGASSGRTRGTTYVYVQGYSVDTGVLRTDLGDGGLLTFTIDAVPPSELLPRGLALAAADGRLTLVLPQSTTSADPRIPGNDIAMRVDVLTGEATTHALPFSSERVFPTGQGFALARGATVRLLDPLGRPVAYPTADGGVSVPNATSITAARLAPDGLYVAGLRRRPSPVRNQVLLSRFSPSGVADPAFWPGGSRALTFPKATQDHRLDVLLGPGRPNASLLALGTSGDGFSDIREDLGPTHLAALRVRTRSPVLDTPNRAPAVDRRGRTTVTVRCAISPCPSGSVRVLHGGVAVGRGSVPASVAPGTRRVVLRLDARGRRLANRRADVELEVTSPADRVRRAARLRRG